MRTTVNIRRILISRMKFIGDVVLTTPAIRAVRGKFPDAHIAYLGDRSAVALLEGNPHLNEILAYDFSRSDLLEQPRMMWQLRRRKFDVFIDLFSNPRSAQLAYASGAAIRIGKDAKGRGSLYTHRIADDGQKKTAIDYHFQYLAPLGIAREGLQPEDYRTEIVLTSDELRTAREYLNSLGIDSSRPVVGLHPGATWPAKMWPKEYFAKLARAIIDTSGAQVVLTQGPKDSELIHEVLAAAGNDVMAVAPMKLRELAAIIASCNTYVANDNGTMHIAAAVGTRTIGIFGPGEDDIWFPYVPPYRDASKGHVVLRHDVSCHPCHLDFCNRTGNGFMECMRGLSVERVFELLKRP